jgi:ABC-type multidrug transport system permease subunit
MLIPQLVAGVYAHSIGKSFWFWFFISFLIPIISLIVLLIIDSKKTKNPTQEKSSYQLADHVIERQEGRRE